MRYTTKTAGGEFLRRLAELMEPGLERDKVLKIAEKVDDVRYQVRADGSLAVWSPHGSGRDYFVWKDAAKDIVWCTCPSWMFQRDVHQGCCKHIVRVMHEESVQIPVKPSTRKSKKAAV